MSQLNGREKATVARAFDVAVSRLAAGESVAFAVALGNHGDHENTLRVDFSRRADRRHIAALFHIDNLAVMTAANIAGAFDALVAQLRKE